MVSSNKSDNEDINAGENQIADISLTDRGLDIISSMSNLAGNESYRKLIGGSEDIEAIIKEISSMNYSSPKQVYKVANLDEISKLYLSMSGLDLESLDEENKEIIINKLAQGIGNIIMAQKSGVKELAASGAIVRQELFVDKSVKECVLYIYTYDDAYPVLISFVPGKDGAVSANASYLIIDEMIGADMETVKDIMKIGLESLQIQEVED
ncbi:MAG: hypothetical protein ACI4D8_00270 [Wujia sp.]